MALQHAAPATLIDVRPYGETLHQARTTALFKTNQLEVIRLALSAGRTVPPHQVHGQITVQCPEGRTSFEIEGKPILMGAGQMLYLNGAVSHALEALDDRFQEIS